MDISIIICTYNRAKSLRQTLGAVTRLMPPGKCNVEVILVNNNSNDDTEDVINNFAADCPYQVRSCFEAIQGLSHARNRGLSMARGDIIAFTDDDVVPENEWLINITNAFEANLDIWCLGGRILPVWSEPRPTWLSDKLLNALALLDLGEENIFLKEPTLWGANMVFRKEVFGKYGFFDVSLGRTSDKLYAGEETAIITSLLNDGKKVLYDANVVVWHMIDEKRLKKRYFRKWFFDSGVLRGSAGKVKGKYIMVPLSPIKQIVINLAKIFCSNRLPANEDKFFYELMMWKDAGQIWGSLKSRAFIGRVR